MKKFFAIIFISIAVLSGCAETTSTVPADAVVCSKTAGCN